MKKHVRIFSGLCLLLICLLAVSSANASAIRAGMFDSSILGGNDDGSTGLINLGFTANFFGTDYSGAYVNNNGNITFDSALSEYTPFGLTATSTPIIAPFFADVDTRSSNPVTYGVGEIDGRNAFGVNWLGVGYYSSHSDLLNSFQLVLTDRSDIGSGDFDIEFNFAQILWETGDASDGNGGLGGSSARVGYANGEGEYFEFAGSGVNGAFLDGGPYSLAAGTNAGMAGRYVMEVRNGEVITAPLATPEPSTVFLLGVGLFGLWFGRKRMNS